MQYILLALLDACFIDLSRFTLTGSIVELCKLKLVCTCSISLAEKDCVDELLSSCLQVKRQKYATLVISNPCLNVGATALLTDRTSPKQKVCVTKFWKMGL